MQTPNGEIISLPNHAFSTKGRMSKWSKFEDVPVHGDTLIGKPDNCLRFYFENVDGFVIPSNQTKKID